MPITETSSAAASDRFTSTAKVQGRAFVSSLSPSSETGVKDRMTALGTGPFRGRFEIKIDPKGRLLIPAAYRQILPVESPQLIITNNRYRGKSCLHAYSLQEWEKLERSIARLSSLKAEVQAFNRFYLSAGQSSDVDAQNRVLVPQSLRKFAGIEGPAVLVGLGNKFEIWSEKTWNSLYEDLTENFEQTLEAVAALEIDHAKKDRE